LFTKKIDSITIAATLVAFSSLASRFLGIFRDRILAGEFGAGNTLDVYYAAFRVPDLIFNLLVMGALTAGFIPILTFLIKDSGCGKIFSFKESPNKEAWYLVNNLLNILLLTLMVLSFLGVVFAPYLVDLIAPGFGPEKQSLTVGLTRIMFLSPIFLGISSILGGILQSFKRFFVYSLAPIFYNLGIIIGALYLVPFLGIYGLAWGVALGAFLHMAVQLPVALKLGYRYRPVFNLKSKNLVKIGKMMIPRTMTLAISQINLLVITIFASTLASGSLSVFNFANNLQSFPVGVFGISFAIAAFPTMSQVAFSKEKLRVNLSQTVRKILFFIVPATVLLITLRAQIVRVVLGTGLFDWQDTILTLQTLGFFAFSLFAQALIPLLIRVFYARQTAKVPFFIGLFAALVNVISVWWFSKILGVAGLALGFSLANIVNFVLLWLTLHMKLNGLEEERILLSAVKFSLGALACGFTVQFTKSLVAPWVEMTKFWGILTQGLIAGILGFSVYLLICYLLRSEELFQLWRTFRKRFPWKKIETGDQGEARGI